MDNDKKGQGREALPDITSRRMIGVSPSGVPVDNVTKANERTVDKRTPWRLVGVYDEDLKNLILTCYIPNTRRMPDIIVLGGTTYEAWDTTKKPPQYRQCMVAQAITTVEKDQMDGKPSTD